MLRAARGRRGDNTLTLDMLDTCAACPLHRIRQNSMPPRPLYRPFLLPLRPEEFNETDATLGRPFHPHASIHLGSQCPWTPLRPLRMTQMATQPPSGALTLLTRI
jgi:hypothetical protein